MEINQRLVAAAALWATAICTMVVALVANIDRLGDVSILVAVMALVPTIAIMMDRVAQREHDRTVRAIFEALGRAEVSGQLRNIR